MSETWVNEDGLLVKFGPTEAAVAKAGEVQPYGNTHLVEFDVLYSDLAAFGTEKILADTVTIPEGALLEKAEFYVETAFAGATATLSFGLIDQDRTTAIDADGIDAAIAVGSLTDGATIACDGDLIGDVLANAGLVTATVGTANFTAGRGKLRLFWYIP